MSFEQDPLKLHAYADPINDHFVAQCEEEKLVMKVLQSPEQPEWINGTNHIVGIVGE